MVDACRTGLGATGGGGSVTHVPGWTAMVREFGAEWPPPRVVIGGEGRLLVCCLTVP
jgi:hypothetical protein